jgi:hypothetical protein
MRCARTAAASGDGRAATVQERPGGIDLKDPAVATPRAMVDATTILRPRHGKAG